MTDGPKVVNLPERRQGNGVRELIEEYFDRREYLRYVLLGVHDRTEPQLSRTDHLLASLWRNGFKIVPVETADCAKTALTPEPTDQEMSALWQRVLNCQVDARYIPSADLRTFGRFCFEWGRTGEKP